MDWVTQFQIVLQVIIAMVLGGLIGIERELASKPAGFRTHMLVAGSAALLIRIGDLLLDHFESLGHTAIQSDPIRIVEAIILGISFLGAGTIIRHRNGEQVEGLTTAASTLLSGAVGICIGLSLYALGASISVLAFVVLYVLRYVDRKLRNRAED
jgi:putative Mg2+ transporter-C (MgtC) family protein